MVVLPCSIQPIPAVTSRNLTEVYIFFCSSNTIRLWYPQLAAMIGSESKSLCSAIAPANQPLGDDTCVPIVTDLLTYLQSVAVGAGSVLTYGIGGVLVNR